MAKLNAPLFSFNASGKLANSLVYFGWKGLDVVRSYVVPTNPKSAAQLTQRGYLAEAVDAIHAAQALAANPLIAIDIIAYALWASIYPNPSTWFNQICRNNMLQRVAALRGCIYRDGSVTPGAAQLAMHLEFTKISGANDVTAGSWYYGVSRTALITSMAATIVANSIDNTIAGLTPGTKYYVQFRPSAHADYVGAYSGIYTGTPT